MISHEILGDDMQAIVMSMGAGDVIRAEAGTLMYMTEGVEMDAKMEGGLLGGLKRKLLAGESLFITYFKGTSNGSKVAFAGPYPGKIIHIALSGQPVLCQRDAFLCCTGDIDLSIAFTKRLGAGFFGGEGFILQKITGDGVAVLHASGAIWETTLAQGETLRVDTGCIVAMEQRVRYDIKMVPGIKTALFGGEGLFFATLSGPGRVLLQTMPFSRLADRIMRAHKGDREDVKRDFGGTLGALGDLIGGDR